MRIYTEYPTTEFNAESDSEALEKTKALVVYRESDTPDGTPFVILRKKDEQKEPKS